MRAEQKPVRPRILIVDEIPPVSRPLAEWLRLSGYETDWVDSAREALLLVQTGRWDAIVLNVGVRAMNGVEFYSRLEGTAGRECLPIIFVTDYSRQGLMGSLNLLTPTPAPEQRQAWLFVQTLGDRLRQAPLFNA